LNRAHDENIIENEKEKCDFVGVWGLIHQAHLLKDIKRNVIAKSEAMKQSHKKRL
jgi:hypothetical protein